jgi:Na+(H+)/acetate symporter ActP
VIRASKRNATADEFFTGGRAFSGPQNGIAIAGDYLSAASFLGIAGAIAVYGYDGFPVLHRLPGRLAGGTVAGGRYCATQANSPWPTS